MVHFVIIIEVRQHDSLTQSLERAACFLSVMRSLRHGTFIGPVNCPRRMYDCSCNGRSSSVEHHLREQTIIVLSIIFQIIFILIARFRNKIEDCGRWASGTPLPSTQYMQCRELIALIGFSLPWIFHSTFPIKFRPPFSSSSRTHHTHSDEWYSQFHAVMLHNA